MLSVLKNMTVSSMRQMVTSSQLEKYDEAILESMKKYLRIAREKHPQFAQSKNHALAYLGEEFGEVAREVTKGTDDRMREELKDLIAVAIRMYNGEYQEALSE